MDIYWIAYILPQIPKGIATVITVHYFSHFLVNSQAIGAHATDAEKQVHKWVKKNGPNDIDSHGEALLHAAAHAGNDQFFSFLQRLYLRRLVQWLISHGATVSLLDEHKWTPLTSAISGSHFGLAIQLLKVIILQLHFLHVSLVLMPKFHQKVTVQCYIISFANLVRFIPSFYNYFRLSP